MSRVISSRCSGAWALMAAWQATNDSARWSSGTGSPLRGRLTSSTSDSISRCGSRPRRSAGTARRTTVEPLQPSSPKPSLSSVGVHSATSSACPAPSSTGCGKSTSWEASGPASRSRSSRSNSTRSCATCWSMKNTSSSLAETTKVSCSWPMTEPNAAVWNAASGSRKSRVWASGVGMSAGSTSFICGGPEMAPALPPSADTRSGASTPPPGGTLVAASSPAVRRPRCACITCCCRSASWTAR